MAKNIIVTGSSRGIGYELIQLLANQGHQVLALSRNAAPATALNHSQITAFPFDITDSVSIKSVVDFIKKEWNHVDVLINNAGVLLNKPFAETSFSDFENVYKVNVFGVANLTRNILPYMDKQSHVVTISSMGGVQGTAKFPGLAAYSSSKGAVGILTELLAEEYKQSGPSFNTLALGAVQTEMLAEAFPGYEAPLSALEMADYIMKFSLEGNRFYNGKVLPVSSSTP
ncbi:MAG: SDR family oxidoreductase [Flavobacteriaceae bacterium]|jgi:NAD(P)-dependent dehydrogenase (short-subunit alcohol dehydrogenase family)|nr:SDR family oxidoreductase [Flavobacteriaceae bacterium]